MCARRQSQAPSMSATNSSPPGSMARPAATSSLASAGVETLTGPLVDLLKRRWLTVAIFVAAALSPVFVVGWLEGHHRPGCSLAWTLGRLGFAQVDWLTSALLWLHRPHGLLFPAICITAGLLASCSSCNWGPLRLLNHGGGALLAWLAFLPSAEALGISRAFAYVAVAFLGLLAIAVAACAFQALTRRRAQSLSSNAGSWSLEHIAASLSMNAMYVAVVPAFFPLMALWLISCYRDPPTPPPSTLSAETKWEIFLRLAAGEITEADAGQRWEVLSTVIGIRRTVEDAALAALARNPNSQAP